MKRSAAEDKYRAFSQSRRRDPETVLATEVYRLLAAGKVLVDVGVAIREAGFDEKMRPKLALARADRKQVHFTWSGGTTGVFNCGTRGAWQPQFRHHVNFNRRHNVVRRYSDGSQFGATVEGFALVPMVPPDVSYCGRRPAECHILWEVEKWADESLLAEPPVDPYLLHRVGGDLFEILGQWDLTEVERYVMAGRAKVGR